MVLQWIILVAVSAIVVGAAVAWLHFVAVDRCRYRNSKYLDYLEAVRSGRVAVEDAKVRVGLELTKQSERLEKARQMNALITSEWIDSRLHEMSLDEIGLKGPRIQAVKAAGISTFGQLKERPVNSWSAIPGVGPKTIQVLKRELASREFRANHELIGPEPIGGRQIQYRSRRQMIQKLETAVRELGRVEAKLDVIGSSIAAESKGKSRSSWVIAGRPQVEQVVLESALADIDQTVQRLTYSSRWNRGTVLGLVRQLDAQVRELVALGNPSRARSISASMRSSISSVALGALIASSFAFVGVSTINASHPRRSVIDVVMGAINTPEPQARFQSVARTAPESPVVTRPATAPREVAADPVTPATSIPAVTIPPPTSMELAATPGCDPNYTPCVPIDSDVDCAGGSGNGPSYVRGPVRVIGRDIYGLDRDGDGIGCE